MVCTCMSVPLKKLRDPIAGGLESDPSILNIARKCSTWHRSRQVAMPLKRFQVIHDRSYSFLPLGNEPYVLLLSGEALRK